MMVFQGEPSWPSERRQHCDRSEWRLAQPVTNCDQCQTIARTNCFRAGGRLDIVACVTSTSPDDLAHCDACRQQKPNDRIGRRRPDGLGNRVGGSGGFAAENRAATIMVDNLITGRTPGLVSGLGLLLCFALLSTTTTTTSLAGPISAPRNTFLNFSCNGQAPTTGSSLASQMMMMLRCDIAPLYEQYLASYHDGRQPNAIGGDEVAARDLSSLSESIGEFVDEAQAVLSLREFCTFSTFSKLAQLKEIAQGNRLLLLAYDLVAIELHTSCLEQTISKLPPVPHLVKDIVKIYLDGADKRVPDLNSPLSSNLDVDDDTPFDVEAAIEKNGSLEQVVGLSLTMFGLWGKDSDTAGEFRRTCKDLVISIEQRWDTMEMMNSMVATDGSAIRQVNNYALRTLSPTKFADICSKISAGN